MAKGDYLTKPRFGKPADAIEQKAADWLEANCGYEGEEVMKSLADLIRSERADAIQPEQPAAETCEYCDSSMEGFSDCPNCKLKGGKIEQPTAPKETGV